MSNPDSLERLIGNLLREQPLRRAPASLEARVLEGIRLGRLDLPWWRQGFSHWPLAARLASLIALALIAKFTLDAVTWLFSAPIPVNQTVESSVGAAKVTASLLVTLYRLGKALADAIPHEWILSGLAFAAGMYFILVALGATAYRTLYLNK